MNVAQLRDYMAEKVIPEKVMPQNITEFLMDEEAELPELDAFTFLNRLHSLGIGSADFLYLLEGCNAPREAIEKIRCNPAMNLQSLIITLDNSGLSSQDYTRMLYTARQIWERTLTMRLENIEEALREHSPNAPAKIDENLSDYSEEYSSDNIEEYSEFDNAADFRYEAHEENTGNGAYELSDICAAEAEAAKNSAAEDFDFTAAMEYYKNIFSHGEDSEQSELAVLRSAERENAAPDESGSDGISDRDDSGGESRVDNEQEFPQGLPFEDSPAEEAISADTAGNDEKYSFEDISEDGAFGNISDNTYEYSDDNSSLDEQYLENAVNNDEEYSEGSYAYEPTESIAETEENVENYASISEEDNSDSTSEFDTLYDETSELVAVDAEQIMQELTADTENSEPSEEQPVRHIGGYHSGAMLAAAVGAAVLFGAGAAASVTDFEQMTTMPAMNYASSNEEIFAQVYSSYYGGQLGSDKVFERENGGSEVFGNLLIEPVGGLGVCSAGDFVYCAESDRIIVYSDLLEETGELLPSDDAEFLQVFEQDGEVYAVFGGADCGFMRLDGTQAEYTVRQDGVLTDISVEDGMISFGSVYVPAFTEDFTAEQTEHYLPRLGTENEVIRAENVLLCGEGCGYAVSASYSLDDGSVASGKAVMGMPIYASADGSFAALEKEDGYIAVVFSEGICSTEVGALTACAYENGLIATAERDENGISVYLRDSNLQPMSVLTNFSEEISSIRLSDGYLYINGSDGIFMAVDCSDAENPKILELTEKIGGIKDGYALCSELSGSLLTFTLYNESGIAYSYSVTLTEQELSTLSLGGINTMIIGAERCGAAYSCFDGVCMVSEYIVFGRQNSEKVLYDDKTGFTAAVEYDGTVYAVCGAGALVIN